MNLISDNIYADCVLPLDKAAIRVLHLKPGNENDRIQGSLRLLDLDTEPPSQYDCVSYVWGNPKSTKSAIINERDVPITKNLHDILRHIRSKTKTVVVWADAICINQSDLNEKSRQVAFMAEIYRHCSKVFVWLGLPEVERLTGNPFEFLEHFVTGKHFYDFPGFERDGLTGRWTWKKNEACSSLLIDFLQIVQSPWWTRAWTVQECLLPKDSLVMFGPWSIKWDDMLKAEYMKNSHGGPTQCCKEAVDAFNPHQLCATNEWMWCPSRGRRFMDILHRNSSRPFYETSRTFASHQCLDPRDKVYSMLALAIHPIYQDFKPNYREDVAIVYTDLFTRMVREADGNFACFMGGGFGSAMPGLPSWVRDFSQIRPLGVVAVEERRIIYASLYQASVQQPIAPLLNEIREFHYKGAYAKTVKAVGQQVTASDTALPQVFSQWHELCREAMAPCEREVLHNKFFHILCGDVSKSPHEGAAFRRARETDIPEDGWDRLMDGDLYALGAEGYGWGVNLAVRGRCLFTTYCGKLGLCYPNTLPGDEVWIMRGVHVPFIVRPRELADAGCASRFSFLGDCFLDGIMYGEMGEKEKSTERSVVMI